MAASECRPGISTVVLQKKAMLEVVNPSRSVIRCGAEDETAQGGHCP